MIDTKNSADLDLLINAAQEAGGLIMGYYRQDFEKWEKAPGDPVTEADLKADTLLKDRLLDARPEYGWLSEETEDDRKRLQTERTFIVDPIDGTRAFVKGKPNFSISLAVVEKGRPVAGVVFAPAHEALYVAQLSAGAALNGEPIKVSNRPDLSEAGFIGEDQFYRSKTAWPEPWPNGMRFEMVNSIALRLALIGAGTFDAMATLRPKSDWDMAAGDLILREAGGAISLLDGSLPVYNRDSVLHDNLVASTPAISAEIRTRLQAAIELWKSRKK